MHLRIVDIYHQRVKQIGNLILFIHISDFETKSILLHICYVKCFVLTYISLKL